jgi:hypothetical protein
MDKIVNDSRATKNIRRMVGDVAAIPEVTKMISPGYLKKTKQKGIYFDGSTSQGYNNGNNQIGLLFKDPKANGTLRVVIYSLKGNYDIVKSKIQKIPYFIQNKDKPEQLDDLLNSFISQFKNSYQVEKFEYDKLTEYNKPHEPGIHNLIKNSKEISFDLFGQSMFLGLEIKMYANEHYNENLITSLKFFNETKNIDYFM